MANQTAGQNHPFRITLDVWLARFGSVFGWFWLIFWLSIGIVGLGELVSGKASATVDVVMPFVCLGFAVLNVFLIRSCRKTKMLVKAFRLYSAYFSHEIEKSIPDAAKAFDIPVETALRQLQEMCRRGYFNGYIDHQRQCMVFPEDKPGLTLAHCPGCGAATAIAKTGDTCRYCGAPLLMGQKE